MWRTGGGHGGRSEQLAAAKPPDLTIPCSSFLKSDALWVGVFGDSHLFFHNRVFLFV